MKKLFLLISFLLTAMSAKAATCGNGVVEQGEACDGGNLNGYSCTVSFPGFVGGTLSCKSSCLGFDVSQCTAGPVKTPSPNTCSETDVFNAVAAANDGDTILVPAGNCTWSSNHLITKSIVLKGAGMEGASVTNIRNNGITLVTLKPANNKPIRLTGFYFDQHSVPQTSYSAVVEVTGLATHVRIDHCYFNTGDWSIAWNDGYGAYSGYQANGAVHGVIDHCKFYDTVRSLDPGDVRSTDAGKGVNQQGQPTSFDGWTTWQGNDPIQPGSLAMMYAEDNTFACTPANPYKAGTQFHIYGSAYGGSLVARNNVFTGCDVAYVDGHGDATNQNSTKYLEIYNNSFTWGPDGDHSGGGIGDMRGGTVYFWGNKLDPKLRYFALSNYYANNGHPIKNSYFWENKDLNGNLLSDQSIGEGTLPNANCPSIPAEGSAFFNGITPANYTAAVYPHPLVVDSVGTPPPSPTATHPGDIDEDSKLTQDEATKYGNCWRSAPTIPLGCKSGANVDYATRAGAIYISSDDGRYTFDANKSCPACWVSP